VRVVVAEDTMLTREGIVRLLADAHVDVVSQVEDATALIGQVRLERPDVAIVDIRMPPTHTD
jgi:DNA-binding NarL/FixJ family response regulator